MTTCMQATSHSSSNYPYMPCAPSIAASRPLIVQSIQENNYKRMIKDKSNNTTSCSLAPFMQFAQIHLYELLLFYPYLIYGAVLYTWSRKADAMIAACSSHAESRR